MNAVDSRLSSNNVSKTRTRGKISYETPLSCVFNTPNGLEQSTSFYFCLLLCLLLLYAVSRAVCFVSWITAWSPLIGLSISSPPTGNSANQYPRPTWLFLVTLFANSFQNHFIYHFINPFVSQQLLVRPNFKSL